MVENGERLPRIDTLMKLAAALEVRLEALVDGIEWLPPGPPAEGSFSVRGTA
jgi:transcriptional regulator with XRE-family HTH domain